jgi:hypothetical protein
MRRGLISAAVLFVAAVAVAIWSQSLLLGGVALLYLLFWTSLFLIGRRRLKRHA